jgi:alkaline phosphatase D
MPLTRRHFLKHAGPLTLAPFLPSCKDEVEPGGPDSYFLHGVASGDPLPGAVILWTRVTLDPVEGAVGAGSGQPLESATVAWRVALDVELTQEVAAGRVTTDAGLDYTVKVDVNGLEPNTTYYYQFGVLDQVSAVGRTKTLPVGNVERLRFAVAACSSYAHGVFNAYRSIAERADLDLVLHLGDYIYEYADQGYGLPVSVDRVLDPPHEISTLDDYRRRHAHYKQDPDLQEVHRQHPFLLVWDDHEFANDTYRDGAQNHQPESEGDWLTRKANALQAYYEWMPVRPVQPDQLERIYRGVSCGDLCDIMILDTRLIGRDAQLADACSTALLDPERSLLGPAQEAWLVGELDRSQAQGTRWRLIGQQVMFGQLQNPLLGPGCVLTTDQWDGYGASRERVLLALEQGGIDNVVILTGDIHSSWASDISPNPFDPAIYEAATGRGSRAVEFVTPGITSPGIEDPNEAANLQALAAATHPHIKFIELLRRGYLLVDVTHERVQAEWYHVETLLTRDSSVQLAEALQVRTGENHVSPASGPTLARELSARLAPA